MNEPFKLDYRSCLRTLSERLSEPPPGRIQVLTGPRQAGKTTLLLDLAERLGDSAVYAAADAPESGLPGFWERLWDRVEDLAETRGKAVLLLDEVQHAADWARHLKTQWDRLKRRKIPVHVVVTGSSALRLGKGSRESMAGRFERMTLAHWSASAFVQELGVEPADAPGLIVRFGSYPGAHPLLGDLNRWRAYIADAIIEPAIGRDILALGAVRRPALLRQVFTLCAAMPAGIISLQKLQGQLQDSGALETIAGYLRLLEDAFLVAAIEKYSTRTLRRRAAPPKIVVLNNAFLAAMDPEGILDLSEDPRRLGSWVENACLAHAWNCGQKVTYWREEPLEVDAVLEGDWGRWAVEVKTGPFNTADLKGLLEFCRRYPRFRPLVLTGEHRGPPQLRDAGVETMSWGEFLLGGPGL
jgi:hypothetical protein